MAKHPHRLMLVEKRTWRCTLDGCNFFVHLGLAHVLVGKRAVCWECGEVFIVDEKSLKNEMPKCNTCMGGTIDTDDIDTYIAERTRKIKSGEIKLDEEDKIESEVVHTSECSLMNGGNYCDCGAE